MWGVRSPYFTGKENEAPREKVAHGRSHQDLVQSRRVGTEAWPWSGVAHGDAECLLVAV